MTLNSSEWRVVCLPRPSFLLVSPVFSASASSIAFNNEDFPTPVLPVKADVLPERSFLTSSAPLLFTLQQTIVLKPADLYIFSYPVYESSRSILVKTIIGSIFLYSAIAINLSIIKVLTAGSTIEAIMNNCSKFASGGLTSEFLLGNIFSILFSELSLTEISTSSPTSGVRFIFLKFPRALHS